MLANFINGDRRYIGTPAKYPNRRYGIVKHPDWFQMYIKGKPVVVLPSAKPMQDRPTGDGKGNTIPISDSWWKYIRKINDDKGYGYARSVGLLWINIKYTTGTPRAESVMSGGNYIAWDEETYTHVKLLSYKWDMDTSLLNPAVHNWREMPWMFWKCSGYDQAGNTSKVLAGVDCYIPRIALTELWINKKSIEIFPDGYDYKFYKSNVYDGDTPLFTIINGVSRFWTGWNFSTKPVWV